MEHKSLGLKKPYFSPDLETIHFDTSDVLTSSGDHQDPNQGEWDTNINTKGGWQK